MSTLNFSVERLSYEYTYVLLWARQYRTNLPVAGLVSLGEVSGERVGLFRLCIHNFHVIVGYGHCSRFNCGGLLFLCSIRQVNQNVQNMYVCVKHTLEGATAQTGAKRGTLWKIADGLSATPHVVIRLSKFHSPDEHESSEKLRRKTVSVRVNA